MPDPEYGPEQELGPKISGAFEAKAAASDLRAGGRLAREARRRVHRRRQTVIAGAAALVVAVAIGGVWTAVSGPSPVASSNSAAAGKAGNAESLPRQPDAKTPGTCPASHPIMKAASHEAVPPGTGLDLSTPVSGLQACRYRLSTKEHSGPALLGWAVFDAAVARQVVDAIKGLPERNASLPVFKCMPAAVRPTEAIVLRFDTPVGIREIWVGYDGCSSAGFFTGEHTYGLFAAPLKLFMTGSVRPSGGTYLDHLTGW